MGDLYIYTSPFMPIEPVHHTDHTFWALLHDVSHYAPETTTIIVSSSQIRNMIEALIEDKGITKEKTPLIQTLDEYVMTAANYRISDSPWHKALKIKAVLENESLSGMNYSKDYPLLDSDLIGQARSLFDEARKYHLSAASFKKYFSQTPIPLKTMFNLETKDAIHCYDQERKTQYSNITTKVQGTSLFFIGFWDLPRYQKKAIEHMIETAQTTSFLLYYQDNSFVYDASHRVYTWLKTIPVTAREIPIALNTTELPKTLELVEAKNIQQEIEQCALTIQDLIQKPGCKRQDIAIIAPQLSEYGSEIQDCFPAHNLPFFIHQNESLWNSPSVQFITALLGMVTQSFSRDAVLAFLRMPFSHRLIDQKTHKTIHFQTHLLETIAYEFNIWKGYDDWKNSFIDKKKEVSQCNDLEQSKKRALLDLLDNQRHGIQCLFTLVSNINNAKTSSDFISQLKNALDAFQIANHIKNSGNIIQTLPTDLQDICNRYKTDHIASHELALKALDQFSKTLDEHALESVNAETTIENLTLFLKHYQFTTNPPIKDCIHVYGKFESFLLNKPHVFVLGMIEKQWPGVVQENILCPDSTKFKLGWPTRATYYQWDVYLFFSMIMTTSTNIFMSYPLQKDGALTVKSHFLTLLNDARHAGYINTTLNQAPLKTTELNPVLPPKTTPETIPSNGIYFKQSQLFPLWKRHQPTSFSATHLETYQTCPYAYFYRHVLKEQGLGLLSEDIPAVLWGQMMHQMMAKLYEAKTDLESIAKSVFEKHKRNTFFWKIRERILFGYEQHQGLIHKIIDDILSSKLGLVPNHFEHAFTINLSESITLSGQIDALFSLTDNHNSLVVTDFKTGKRLATPEDIRQFRHLQLPLYMMACTNLFPTKNVVAGSLYHIADVPTFGHHFICITPTIKERLELKRKRPSLYTDDFNIGLKRHLNMLISYIQEGYFKTKLPPELSHMATKQTQFCLFCPYQFICIGIKHG